MCRTALERTSRMPKYPENGSKYKHKKCPMALRGENKQFSIPPPPQLSKMGGVFHPPPEADLRLPGL